MAKHRAAAVVVRGIGPGSPTSSVDQPDWGRLSAALEAGDADTAVPLLLDRYGEAIYRYCRGVLGPDADAEDVSQTVFIQAFEAIRRRTPIIKVRGWLMGIARHRCLDRLDKRRRGPILLESEELERTLDSESAGEAPREPRANQDVDDCLDALDGRSRVAVLLRFHDQLSYDEIGALTGDQPGALRVRVARALRSLRGCLEKKGVGP